MDQKSYQKYKYKVKIWETSFKKTYGRIPSKHDIHEAEQEIREAYKMYFKLKSALLEETLIDINFDDVDLESTQVVQSQECREDLEFDTPCTPTETTVEESKSDEFVTEEICTALGKLTDLDKENTSWNIHNDIVENKDNTWGTHLSNKLKNTHKIEKSVPKEKNATIKLSQKLFKNSSFSKRNPRKSLSNQSFNKSDLNLSSSSLSQPNSQSSQEIDFLPDLSQILEKQADLQNLETNTSSFDIRKLKPLRSFDQGWLDRCNISNSLETKKESVSDSGFNSLETSSLECGVSTLKPKSNSNTPQSYGLRNIDLSIIKSLPKTEDKIFDKNASDSDDIVHNSESEDDSSLIKHVAKRRKITSSQSLTSTSVQEIVKSSPPFTIVTSDTVHKNQPNPNIKNIEFQENSSHTGNSVININEILKSSLLEPEIEPNTSVIESQDIKTKIQRKVVRPKRSTRKQNIYVDQDEDVNEDPFHSDNDEDRDPDFLITEDKIEKVEEETEIAKPKKTRKSATRKTGVQKKPKPIPKVTKSGRITKVKNLNFHKSLQVRAKNVKKKQIEDIDEEPVEKSKEDEYELEFSVDPNASHVSRFGVCVDADGKGDLVKEFASAIGATTQEVLTKNLKPVKGFDEDKLKKKAYEKMNENFVRIDMKKKVYVRGKKPMNFSRYKKARWKERKAAALAGPDMDMGGCDGGLLKCFKCGNVGHFAAKCKAKVGDKLLPLEADVEVSPYPSLEEASAMASETILLAHANRPKLIPQAKKLPLDQIIPQNNDTITDVLPTYSNTFDNILSDLKANFVDDKVDKANLSDGISKEFAEVSEKLERKFSENNVIETVNTNKIEVNDELNTTWKRHVIPEALRNELMSKNADDKVEMKPLYELNPDGSLIETPQEVFSILSMFGHTNFRPGQEKAIMRILSGLSTLVTLSTGSGKSLCYQLPAYLYAQTRPCITLVISPLVSLMEDQVTGVPDFLNATCLHTNQTPAQREKILQAVQSGVVNILLVSPEAVVSSERKTGFGALLRSLPSIAFACIDEAHCVSQWSHNFRPSYLMICQVLREKLGVKVVLGLTATATRQTRESIVRHLEVPDGLNGIISDIPLPNNLLLSVSKDANRDRALIELLRSERFANLQSIIVYCTRRQECERVAGYIRTCLQDNKPPEERRNKRKRVMWNAEPYHAGMAASRRRTIQAAFMAGDLRIVVATVAFGMGINKSDIRAIIHYNMPRTFENYVQEVGRAGRDGLEAHCHLFLDSRGEDQSELKRHIYADSIDRHVIRKLLQRVFLPCKCEDNKANSECTGSNQITENERKDIDSMQNLNWSDTSIDEKAACSNISIDEKVNTRKRVCPGHEVAFSVEETVQVLDIPKENISTLLCYLELHQNNYVHVLSPAFTKCQITSYGGPKQLRLAAQSCPPLAMAIALDLKRGINHDETSVLEFKVIDIAAAIGWDSGVVKYQLKKLEWITVNGASKRSTLNVEFSELGFRVRSAGDLTDDELDETLDMLYHRTSKQENTALLQLQAVFEAMTSVAFNNCEQCSSLNLTQKRSDQLKIIIRGYFQKEKEEYSGSIVQKKTEAESQIILDVRTMVANYPENNFTGRTLARIFYGIQSPNYPAMIWARCRYWRAHLKEDFHVLINIANREIIKMR